MAHEIMEHDDLVLVNQSAWHGLGTVVLSAPTPTEALKMAHLDWEVLQDPIIRRRGLNRQRLLSACTASEEQFEAAIDLLVQFEEQIEEPDVQRLGERAGLG